MIIEAIKRVAGVRRLFQETTCGKGSFLKNTGGVRHFLESVIKEYQIKSILDVGCGDWNWIGYAVPVPDQALTYVGLDFDAGFIRYNNRKFGRERSKQHKHNISFYLWDVRKDVIPDKFHQFDLIICRDLMLHLPTEVNLKLLREFDKVGKYLIASNHGDTPKNIELPAGKYRRTCRPSRRIYLEFRPYNLPLSIGEANDGGDFRYVDLWKLPVMKELTPQETHRALDDWMTRRITDGR